MCSLCEQNYHGVVACALGWACWKTYLGRPETDWFRRPAMHLLGTGLSATDNHEDALSVREAHLSLVRRLGASEEDVLAAQSNIAITYQHLGRLEEALSMRRDTYSGTLNIEGEESRNTQLEALNYANVLLRLKRFEEAKSLLRKTMPVARRVLRDSHELTLRMRLIYARALYQDDSGTLDDLREAVSTLEEAEQTARRVLGGAHPLTGAIEESLQETRAVLRACEGGDVGAVRAALDAMTVRKT